MLPPRYRNEVQVMTEQKLIDTINALIDADLQAECPALKPKDLARRAIDRCGEGVFTTEAVTDLNAADTQYSVRALEGASRYQASRISITLGLGARRSTPSFHSRKRRPAGRPGNRSR